MLGQVAPLMLIEKISECYHNFIHNNTMELCCAITTYVPSDVSKGTQLSKKRLKLHRRDRIYLL